MTAIPDSEVIRRLGGATETARICEVTPQAASQWMRDNKMPRARRMYLQLLRPDVFLPAKPKTSEAA